MHAAAFGFAFVAGMLASVNPCGFVMLPALIGYYLGAEQPAFAQQRLAARLARAIGLSFVVTLGFALVFGTAGALAMSGGRALLAVVPYVAVLVGVGLVALGLWLLAGRGVHLPLPQWAQRRAADHPLALLVFGISYAVASISCALPIFLIAVGQSLLAASWRAGLLTFIAYSAGMGSVVLAVSLAAALAQASVARWLRGLRPMMSRLSGALIALAGIYIVLTQLSVLRVQG
jgi:cytochrome c-type biogenesis protein